MFAFSVRSDFHREKIFHECMFSCCLLLRSLSFCAIYFCYFRFLTLIQFATVDSSAPLHIPLLFFFSPRCVFVSFLLAFLWMEIQDSSSFTYDNISCLSTMLFCLSCREENLHQNRKRTFIIMKNLFSHEASCFSFFRETVFVDCFLWDKTCRKEQAVGMLWMRLFMLDWAAI